MPTASSSKEVPPLAKYLASTDKATRDKAIKNLSAFLSTESTNALPKSEMTKLWKGIFYCFWMSDKPLVQQALASEIAEIVLNIPNPSSSLEFLRGFWETIVREWSGIDQLRIDKYYMLVRRFVNASFRMLIRSGWDQSLCSEYNTILTDRGGPLCPQDTRVPTSLAYHLTDIYLEELDKALGSSSSPILPAPLSTLITPFFALAALTTVNTTYKRVQDALLEPMFTALSPRQIDHTKGDTRSPKRARVEVLYEDIASNACLSDPKKEGAMEMGFVRKALLTYMFDVASKPETRDANRRKLYALWKSMAEDADEDGEEPAIAC
ncbi:hypothetical protein PHLCEN_2v2772 [Hermanssonia centrifuga]|uniref:Nop52-domain-containing protein n=1 Tax=Hermanssonia centrifuga TaxID=98765 RepID=A0A2R6RHX0_9APHY|nr:hypothetical protein PHLCEN_2v2772 [Hermanssonia centrifuga]